MQARAFETAKDLLRDVERDLSHREVEHHLLLGVAYGLAAGGDVSRTNTYIAIRDSDGLALAALMTPPRPLLLESDRRGEDVTHAVRSVAECLQERQATPKSVISAEPHASAFAMAWEKLTGAAAEVRMRQREYVLRAVSPIRTTTGALRRAAEGDLPLIERWMTAFNTEALLDDVDPELRHRITKRVSMGEVFLWDDPEPRAMAASARPTRRGIAVNSVYTPREWRGRGYATSCVAKLSELLLAEGRAFCVLYTDTANPTSNAIYTRIGYRPVADSVVMRFEIDRK